MGGVVVRTDHPVSGLIGWEPALSLPRACLEPASAVRTELKLANKMLLGRKTRKQELPSEMCLACHKCAGTNHFSAAAQSSALWAHLHSLLASRIVGQSSLRDWTLDPLAHLAQGRRNPSRHRPVTVSHGGRCDMARRLLALKGLFRTQYTAECRGAHMGQSLQN